MAVASGEQLSCSLCSGSKTYDEASRGRAPEAISAAKNPAQTGLDCGFHST